MTNKLHILFFMVFCLNSCNETVNLNGSQDDINSLADEFYFRLFDFRESNGGENPSSLHDLMFEFSGSRLKWKGEFYTIKYDPESNGEFLLIFDDNGKEIKRLTSECGIAGPSNISH
jgi:hypothetical protein